VEFHFDVCFSSAPDSWGYRVTRRQNNATGENLGQLIDDASVKLVHSGSQGSPDLVKSATWEGLISWKSCAPKLVPEVGGTCFKSGTYKVEFHGTARKDKAVVDYKIVENNPDRPLFTTP
jgi:hypothetical protein